MFERSPIVDEKFLQIVQGANFSTDHIKPKLPSFLDGQDVLEIFESQILSRHLDFASRQLKKNDQSFYTIGSAGHEGNAVIGRIFRHTDMAFLHYRSGAFMMERSRKIPGQTPIYDTMLSFTVSSEEPISGGRHKVWGSTSLFVPPQTSTIASHLPKAVGMAFSIPRMKKLGLPSVVPSDSVVLCSFGDASTNHSTALGAFNSASWSSFQNFPLPIVFICEDNGVGISVPTPHEWIHHNFKNRPGIKYFSCDGRNILDTYLVAHEVERYVRQTRRPAFLHMKVVRLLGHAGSDIESLYHSPRQIEEMESLDPLIESAKIVCALKLMTPKQIVSMYKQLKQRVLRVSQAASLRPKIKDAEEVASSLIPTKKLKNAPAPLNEEKRKTLFGKDYKLLTEQKWHMAKLINWALTDLMGQYPNSFMFGEDVAKKGGVYHVTAGLYQKFGTTRVFNTLLDEQTIIGLGIGMSHNGALCIPEIQFLAYYHNAEDQIRGEAATLSFFSNGQFTNPMVLRIAGLAYQKGFGGHFHNDNSFAALRDVPGIVLACPSNGACAVKMFRRLMKEAYEYGRVCIFLEPIALYMTKDLNQKDDGLWNFTYPKENEEIEIGEFALYGKGVDLLIISYANGLYFSLQAQKILQEQFNIHTTILDLRWLAPLNSAKILECVQNFENILIVDECRKTGSISEQLSSLILENIHPTPQVKILAADDCFIPLGPAANFGLPNCETIIQWAKSFMKTKKGIHL